MADIGATLGRHRLDALPALAPTAAGALTGRTILVPRPEDDRIVDAIRAAGAAVIAHPMTRIEPLDADVSALRSLLTPDAAPITHVAVTSPRTVERLVGLGLIEQIRDVGLIVSAVGPASTAAAEAAGLTVTIRGTHDAATLATAMIDASLPDQPTAGIPDQPPAATPHAWLPASALASDTLADALTVAGWQVTRTPLYTSRPVESVDQDVADAWRRGLIDAVVITAPSVADALRHHLGHAGPGTAVIAIGEPSAHAIRAGGGILAATATEPTPAAIVAALSTIAKD
nr:uroporphyrinogen-III synthase [Bowdeniella nasicola]